MLRFNAGTIGGLSLVAAAALSLGAGDARADHRRSSCGYRGDSVRYDPYYRPSRVVYTDRVPVRRRVIVERPYRSRYYSRRPIYRHRRSIRIDFGHRRHYNPRIVYSRRSHNRGRGISIRVDRGRHHGRDRGVRVIRRRR